MRASKRPPSSPPSTPSPSSSSGESGPSSARETTTATLVKYASPRFGCSLLLTFVDFSVLFLYHDVYALSGWLTGIAAGLGKASIAASTFVAGYFSDKTRTRWGKRRPYLLFGAPVLATAFVLLFIPTFVLGYRAPELAVFAWYVAFNCSFQAMYGFVTGPYHAIMPAITRVDQRPRTAMYQNLFNYLATGLGALLTFLVLPEFTDTYATTGVLPPGFVVLFVVSAAVLVTLFYYMHRAVPVAPDEFKESADNFVANLHVIRANTNYLRMIAFQGVTGLAAAMQTSLLLGYVETVLALEGPQLYVVAACVVVGVGGFVSFWRWLIEQRGKKRVLQYVLLYQACSLPLSLVGLVPGAPLLRGIVFVVGMTAGMAGWGLFPYMIYADVAEDHARRTGEYKAGLFQGFSSVPLNIFQAISLFATGWLLDLPLVAGTTYSWGYLLWGPLGAVYVVVAFLILKRWVQLDYAWESRPREEA